ncbi:MAG TPA: aminotransferase class III-fold pyridoxal phosphate-dependent enzyme, partial [Ferruginibacter sp.]|nr:aminotransferase class III-fold pyridoxal phosphate-dependent enzyme [Ferruginibacter sp.]
GIVPDILLLGKALGGGMPLGAFVADRKIMNSLTHDPVLGHINTFGGHPVCCAAGLAAFDVLLDEKLVEMVGAKEQLFLNRLQHPKIGAVRSRGLMMAVEFDSFGMNKKIIDALISEGVFTDWFLFADNCLRIVPPLNIQEQDIQLACDRIISVLNRLS